MKSRFRMYAMLGLLLVSCGSMVYGGEVIFSDTFTGPSGAQIRDWIAFNTPEEGYWFYQDGELASGAGDVLIEKGGYTYLIPDQKKLTPLKNYSIQANIRTIQMNGTIILIGRWQDEDNHYEGILNTFENMRTLRIDKVQEGQRIILAKGISGRGGISIPPIENSKSPADALPIKMYFIGKNIYLTFENNMLRATDSAFKKGFFGIGQRYNYAFFDNVIVERLTADTIPHKVTGRKPGEPSYIEPTSVMPGQVYRIVMGTQMDKEMTDSLRDQLLSWGYGPVLVLEKNGRYEIRIGAFLSETEAKGKRRLLEDEGLVPGSIVAETITPEDLYPGKRVTQKQFSVVVGSAENRIHAQPFLDQLLSEGYITGKLIETEEGFDVSAGTFKSKTEALKLADRLSRDGYVMTKVVEQELAALPILFPVREEPTKVPGEELIPKSIREGDIWKSLTEEQKLSVIQMLKAEQELIVAKEKTLSEDVVNIRENVRSLSDKQQNLLQQIQRVRSEEQYKESQISRILDELNAYISAGKMDKARERLARLREVDPNNAHIAFKEREIAFRQKQLPFEAEEVVQEKTTRLEEIENVARKFEEKGNLEAALLKWTDLRNEASENSKEYITASQNIRKLEQMVQDRQTAEQRRQRFQQITIYATATGLVLLLLLLGLFVIRARKRDRELLKHVRALGAKPMVAMEGLPETGPAELPREPVKLPEGKASKEEAPVAARASVEDQEPIEQEVAADESSPEMVLEPSPQPPPPPPAEEIETPALEEMFNQVPAADTKEEAPSPFPEEGPAEEGNEDAFEQMFAGEGESTTSSESDILGKSGQALSTADTESVSQAPSIEESIEDTLPDISDLLGEGKEETPDEAPVAEKEEAPPDIIPSEMLGLDEKEKEEVPAETSDIDLDIDALLSEGVAEEKPAVEEAPITEPSAPEPSVVDASQEQTAVPPAAEQTTAEVSEKPPDLIPIEEIEVIEEETQTGIPDESITAKAKDETVKLSEAPEFTPDEQTLPGAASKKAPKGDVYYEQNCEDEEVGTVPTNWKGQSEYATLIVSDTTPPPSATKYLKFDKPKGGGSAYFSCNIGNLLGRVAVEFDINCVEKNKYLLGFYIEKDEDFRQSVHTIIHYTEGQIAPTLRVQSEPTPYEMGKWRHVKYIIDLIDGTTDCYVDDLLVANRIKLASVPKVINTLSIRDNLATTGTMLIGNIKVYKA